ncbi:MAG: hypothetical protein NTZ05_13320 [Chloroflexi bacterium]|nr:hypothetical protein [Chloroflexota bacterium]
MKGIVRRLAGLTGFRPMAFGLIVVGALGGQVNQGTVAYFTSTQTSVDNRLVSGSVTLSPLANAAVTQTAPTYLKPGDIVTGALAVTHSGLLDTYYSVAIERAHPASPAATALENALLLTVRTRGTGAACNAANGDYVVGSASVGVPLTAVLHVGHTYTAAASVYNVPAGYLFGNGVDATANSVLTNGSAGARTLGASSAETLCLAMTLPLGSDPGSNSGGDNAFKDTTVNYTLTVKASQQFGR